MAPIWVFCLSTASHRREETRIFPSLTLLHRSPPSAPPFPVWEQPHGALCPETRLHPHGKSTFPIFSFIQNLLLLPAPPEQRTVPSPRGPGAIRKSPDVGRTQTAGLAQNSTSVPVSLHPHRCQEEMQKIPAQAAVEQPPVSPGTRWFLYFLSAFFLGSIPGEIGCSDILGQ